jgi:hypothetical protein
VFTFGVGCSLAHAFLFQSDTYIDSNTPTLFAAN